MRNTNFPVDKRFLPLLDKFDAAGLEKFYYPSEFWFWEPGLEFLRKRAGLPNRVDDATPEEKKFAELAIEFLNENK